MPSSVTEPQDLCSVRLKALADPTRLAVVRRLLDGGPGYVGAINESLGLDQSLLSHHLKVLREAGLVEAEREGKAVRYRLADGVDAQQAGGEMLDLGCCKLEFD
ncbi:MAG: metalloregulator ArsR/SmtB family transcription factor [Planctomycetota bacterium]